MEALSIMFSSRLRNTSEWAEAISGITKYPSRWKEINLSNHDIEFQFSSTEFKGTFHLLLMSSNQVHHSEEKKRIGDLAAQDCAKKGIMVLLQGTGAMSSWMKLQMYMLQHNNITVMPLSRCQQLAPTVEQLRSHCNVDTNSCLRGDEQAIREETIRNCVQGRPLAHDRIAKVMTCVKGLSHLVALLKTKEGQEKICNILGKDDGQRLMAYFEEGPKPQ